jgi:serine/threonine protein kinase
MSDLIDILARFESGVAAHSHCGVESFFSTLPSSDRNPEVLTHLAISELSRAGWPDRRLDELIAFIRQKPASDQVLKDLLNRRYEEQVLEGVYRSLSEYDQYQIDGLTLQSEEDPFPLGESICGQFRLTRRIGMGGFGVVFEAMTGGLTRVAVKTVRCDGTPARISQARALLSAEAEALQTLDHPAFPQFIAWDENWRGFPCLVTELIEGMTLRDHLQRFKLTAAEAARVIRDIASTLYFVHSHGVLHRDLTPSNIVLRPDGRVVLLDFGLSVREEELLQREGEVVGTRGHQSPDTILGALSDMDARSDVWCLGQLLQQCMTGQPTFDATSKEDALVQAIVAATLPRKAVHFPQELEVVVERCLHANPILRYDTALDVAIVLNDFLGANGAKDLRQICVDTTPLVAFRLGNRMGEVHRHLDAFSAAFDEFQNAKSYTAQITQSLIPPLFMANEEARNIRILLPKLGVTTRSFDADSDIRGLFYKSAKLTFAHAKDIHAAGQKLTVWLNDTLDAIQETFSHQSRSTQALFEFGLLATLPRSIVPRQIDLRRIAPLTGLPSELWEPYVSYIESKTTDEPVENHLRLLSQRVARHFLYPIRGAIMPPWKPRGAL